MTQYLTIIANTSVGVIVVVVEQQQHKFMIFNSQNKEIGVLLFGHSMVF